MRALILVCALAASFPVPAFAQFAWPDADTGSLTDAGLTSDIQIARGDAQAAEREARIGDASAGQARRTIALRSALGRGPEPERVSDGLTRLFVRDEGVMLGTLTWESGVRFTGDLSEMFGVYEPEPDSQLLRFSGWLQRARPMTGVFEFRNGDEFRGQYNLGSNASGTYTEAGGERHFIGLIDLSAGVYRPLRGFVEDRRGRVLAVVRQ